MVALKARPPTSPVTICWRSWRSCPFLAVLPPQDIQNPKHTQGTQDRQDRQDRQLLGTGKVGGLARKAVHHG